MSAADLPAARPVVDAERLAEQHRIATTAIIFRRDGRMLITKRAEHKKVWPGRWTVPGGGLSTDDYTGSEPTHTGSTEQWYHVLDRSLRREVHEEVGLEIGPPRLVCDLAFIRPDGQPVVVLSYMADYVSGEVRYDADTVDHAWVTVDEAADFDLIDGIHWELGQASKARVQDAADVRRAVAELAILAAADEMEAVITEGDVAEVAAPVPGEVNRSKVVAKRDALYEEPAKWLRDNAASLARGIGATP